MSTPPPARAISDAEARIAGAYFRRAGTYVEVAPDDPTMGSFLWNANSFPHERRAQDYPASAWGTSGLGAVSVCRLGDMREALAMVSTDGANVGEDALPNIVSVRVQSSAEGFGYPHLAFQTEAVIRDITLISSNNPVLNVNPLASEDKVLVLCIWYGADPDSATLLLVSTNYGQSWATAWSSTTGRVRQPRLTQSTDGKVYLFFRDSLDDNLKYYVTSVLPSTWETSFAWDGSVATLWSLQQGDAAPTTFDMTHDQDCWVYGGNYMQDADSHVQVRLNTSADPGSGVWIECTTDGYGVDDSAGEVVRVGRAGGHNEFGNYPRGGVIVMVQDLVAPSHRYTMFQSDLEAGTVTERQESGYGLCRNPTVHWQEIEGGFYWFWSQLDPPYQDYNKLSNKEVWNQILTPSTSIKYGSAGTGYGNLGKYVEVDTHGPTDTDTDAVDTFPGWWTRSNELCSVAFPPYTPGVDVDIYFRFATVNAQYHNVWFVIDDPANPGWPIFKADFYDGHDSAVGEHPHDTARGMAIWFCREQWKANPLIDSPLGSRGTPAVPYTHPLQMMFRGFDDHDDNQREWGFWIHYDASADMFELKWEPTLNYDWEPFVPYAASHPSDTREYVDVGPSESADEYVASSTEKYWRQPRRGLWPRRIYFGCPEQKPAIKRQSGLRVGQIMVWTGDSGMGYALPNACCVTPRLSGGLDLWYCIDDVLYRHTNGHAWSDLYTLTSFRASAALNGAPDQADIVVQNSDTAHSTIYDNLRHYHVMAYARGGSRTRQEVTPFAEGGEWGAWRPIFFGTSDTGEPQDADSGSVINMRAYSPLRDLSRSARSQSFTSIEPPSKKRIDGTDEGVVDEKKMREWGVTFMRDFAHPADLSLPVDSKGRLMRYEDYIARVVWEDLLQNDADKLHVERVGFTPTNFTVNQGGKSADLLEDLRALWTTLGLYWWYDYDNGGILRVWKRASFGVTNSPLVPDITLKARAQVATPFSRSETDWQRVGNAVTTASNMESRPNMAVARVAPWPDGADASESGIDALGGLASQAATGEMYRFQIPLNALTAAWEGAKTFTLPLSAYPYVRVGMVVAVEVEEDQPTSLKQRYAGLARAYFVHSIDTEWSADALTSTLTLGTTEAFPS